MPNIPPSPTHKWKTNTPPVVHNTLLVFAIYPNLTTLVLPNNLVTIYHPTPLVPTTTRDQQVIYKKFLQQTYKSHSL